MSDLEEPYDPEVTQQLILLALMRIYDVNMSILSHLNDERAELIEEAHDNGKTLTDVPWLQ